MWGGSEWVDQSAFKAVPPGMELKVTPEELDEAYGLEPNPVVKFLEDEVAGSGKFESDVMHELANAQREARVQHPRDKLDHVVTSSKPLAALPGNQESRRVKVGTGERAVRGQVLSPIGQEEQGVNPRGQPCPNWGLESTEFKVVGFAAQAWRKTVEIRSMEDEVLGTIKRGCPAWTNSFVWMVPKEHASGCRDHVDPNVFSSKCQLPETEILYTDEFSGLLNPSEIKIMDCHDDQIFSLHEQHREIIIHDYKIKSDFMVKDLNGNTMGYCRQVKDLNGKHLGVSRVGDHNFTIVDLEGEVVATATRPFHWANGATEREWQVVLSLLV